MVSMNQIEAGIARYIDAEIAPNISIAGQFGPAKKIAFLTGAAYLVRHSRGILEEYLTGSFAEGIGLHDGNGNIDLDGLMEVLKENIPEAGLSMSLPFIGEVVFYKPDVDVLHKHITGGKAL